MKINNLAAAALRKVSIEQVLENIGFLTEIDRYQASDGICVAAEFIASVAENIGLSDISVRKYPVKNHSGWWSFQSPGSWTPLKARFSMNLGEGKSIVLDHDCIPFTVATNSADVNELRCFNLVEFDLLNSGGEVDKIAIVPQVEFEKNDVLNELISNGVSGFVTDYGHRKDIDGQKRPGRFELPKDTKLFGFCTTTDVLNEISCWAKAGVEANVIITTNRSAPMPVVSAMLPGREDNGEIWLVAHSCHPRPSANDNASGVCGVLEIARLLACDPTPSRNIRFVWGPEFTGLIALLHEKSKDESFELPEVVLNFDMIGCDPKLCGGSFIIERPLNHLMYPAGQLSEAVVAAVFKGHDEQSTWKSVPFTGYSDHALFADASMNVCSIQFAHDFDQFNHSGCDTIDKVSSVEMTRAIASGYVTAGILARQELREDSEICQAIGPASRAVRVSSDVQLMGINWNPNKAIFRSWVGPFNFRSFVDGLITPKREVILSKVASDKRWYSAFIRVSSIVNGKRTYNEIFEILASSLSNTEDLAREQEAFKILLSENCVSISD